MKNNLALNKKSRLLQGVIKNIEDSFNQTNLDLKENILKGVFVKKSKKAEIIILEHKLFKGINK